MLAAEILTALQEAGTTARVDGEKLLVEPRNRVPAELVPEIREHKTEIVALLSSSLPAAFDRPPQSREETVELMNYLADQVAFAQWFERLMARSVPSETDEGESKIEVGT